MVDDPYTYDLTDFAREFTWSIIFWNLAENHARFLLSGILGGHETMHALASDLGNRTLNEALRSAARGLADQELRQHVEHFCKGLDRLVTHRNLYVHGLMAAGIGEPNANNVKPLHGRIMITRGKGRLRAVDMDLPTSEISKFKEHCLKLLNYGKAITTELGFGDSGLENLLGMPEPLLEKPEWPAPPKTRIQYIQD